MAEPPVEALRKKGDSSIARAVELVATREADALVSAGNTGAAVVATTLSVRLLQGARRPGIAVALPTRRGACTVMDVGANLNCRPKHLLQYGLMASEFAGALVGCAGKPTVGLLNVGEEDAKGTDIIKEAYALMRDSALNFVGNVEGRDIYRGNCDVVVCDGFVGNTILKLSEGLCEAMFGTLKDGLLKTFWRRWGAWLCRGAIEDMRVKCDYTEYGGAFLLGIDGVCVICHGRSNARAIANAIRRASEMVHCRLNESLVAALAGARSAR
jgi:glycerol-3-phosphate acyltransferase PlsX